MRAVHLRCEGIPSSSPWNARPRGRAPLDVSNVTAATTFAMGFTVAISRLSSPPLWAAQATLMSITAGQEVEEQEDVRTCPFLPDTSKKVLALMCPGLGCPQCPFCPGSFPAELPLLPRSLLPWGSVLVVSRTTAGNEATTARRSRPARHRSFRTQQWLDSLPAQTGAQPRSQGRVPPGATGSNTYVTYGACGSSACWWCKRPTKATTSMRHESATAPIDTAPGSCESPPTAFQTAPIPAQAVRGQES